MIDPALAPVRPRIISPGSGETFLLEEFVTTWAQRERCGVIQLLGTPGAGKTTALRHLAAALPAELNCVMLDDAYPEEAEARGEHGIVVFGDMIRSTVGIRRKLAGWTDDDLIEYLLANHRDRTASVYQRAMGWMGENSQAPSTGRIDGA